MPSMKISGKNCNNAAGRLGLLLKKHLMSPRSPCLCEEFVKAVKLDKLPDSADCVKVEVQVMNSI